MKTSLTPALFAILILTPLSLNAATYTLLSAHGSAGISLWENSSFSGSPDYSDLQSFSLAPPSVLLGSASDAVAVQYVFPDDPDFAVVPWAATSMDFNAYLNSMDPACGDDLDIATSALGNLGILNNGVLDYETQPTVAWLAANQIPSFSGSVAVNFDYLIEVEVAENCEACTASGSFERGDTPFGPFEPITDCLGPGIHFVQQLSGGGGLGMNFSWDLPTEALVIDDPIDVTVETSFTGNIPEPSSALLSMMCAVGLLMYRRL